MIKKFVSMSTAIFLLASGISLLTTPSASAAACPTGLLSPSSTIKGVALTVGSQRPSSSFSDFYPPQSPLRSSVSLTAAQASGSGITSITTTDGSPAYWLYIGPGISSFSHNSITGTSNQANETIVSSSPQDFIIRIVPTSCDEQYYWVSINAGGGSTPAPTLTAEQIAANAAAAAKAAADAAAVIRAAEIAAAQTKLSTVLKSDKPGSLDDYRSANIKVTTDASLTRLNAEVLKLSANDRADFAKIKAIADKIEFDESFFNATSRPTVATYNAYGVYVTERTLATVNAKVLELPAEKRLDVTAIQEIVKVESFVDRVANPVTRTSVPSTVLISKGLLTAETPYKYSVVQGLSLYPEESLNSMAKIEAAIAAELTKAGARKAKTAEIKARIAARKL